MTANNRYEVKRIKNRHHFGPYWLWEVRIMDKIVHRFEFSEKKVAEKFVKWYKKEVAA